MNKPVFNARLLHPRYWFIWLVMAVWWLLVQLPYPLLVGLAYCLAPMLRWLGSDRRHVIAVNLRLCFPDKTAAERERLLRQNYFSMAMALFETGIAWFWPRWRLRRLYTIRGLEHLPLQPQRGILLMAMHFTTLDLGAAMINQERRVTGMYRPHKNPVYDYVQRRGRERHWAECEAITRKDVRGMLRALRRCSTVWYAPDQDYGRKQSVFVPFFGVPAATVTATAKFASLGKAQVIPFIQRRLPRCRGYEVVVYPPLEDFPSGDESADAARINRFVETRILEQPEQYLWAHRRFKSRPAGAESVY